MRERLDKARFSLRKSNLEALLVSSEANILYLTGFPGKDSLLLLTQKRGNYFLADSRIYDEAKTKVNCANLVRLKKIDSPLFKNILIKNKIRKLGFESQCITYHMYKRLNKALNKIRLLPTEAIIERLRTIKSQSELSKIKKASYLTKKIFKEISKLIRPGITEIDIAKEIDVMIKRHGGSNSFETIVATGSHSSWPHATTSTRKIRPDNLLLIDFGAKVCYYCSDLSRVIFIGSVSEKFRRMHDVIKKAQEKALALIRPQRTISSIVKKVNGFIEKAGFGKFILHGLGHGIGLEIHEFPHLSVENNSRIKQGMVFTIEPGIYIPGLGGVRIEDVVYVTKDGSRVLTR